MDASSGERAAVRLLVSQPHQLGTKLSFRSPATRVTHSVPCTMYGLELAGTCRAVCLGALYLTTVESREGSGFCEGEVTANCTMFGFGHGGCLSR